MKQNFEISSTGIKFSFRRFLSDTAIGLVILFLFINDILKINFGQKEIFYYILLFIITTPLGLLINISSWITLGFFQYYLSRYFFLKVDEKSILRFFLYATFKVFNIVELKKIFKLNKDNYFLVITTIERYLKIYYPEKISYYEDLIGMRIFYRNVALVGLIYFFYYSINYGFKCNYLGFLFVFLFFMFANVVVTIYGVGYLLSTFLLIEKRVEFNNLEDFLKVLDELAKNTK